MKISIQKLNECMAAKGIFIKDLCRKVNMNELAMKKLLSGGGDLDMRTALKIAHVFGIKVQDLEESTEGGDQI